MTKVINHIYLYIELFKYGISSLLSSFVDVGIFALFLVIFTKSSAFEIFIYTFIARVISGIFNYYLNKKFVFQIKEKNKSGALKFCLIFFLRTVASWFFVELILKFKIIPAAFAKMIVDTSMFQFNYIFQKKLVFQKKN